MKVRAIALATERSNAVGTVELECTPLGLLIVYLGVGSFSEGYAPAALTSGTRVLVPWSAVREARVEGDQVYLAIEPTLTPHSRLTLTNFSTGDAVHDQEIGRQRMVLRVGAIGAALVVALCSALGILRMAPQMGAALTIAVGIGAAGAVLLVGLVVDHRVGFVPLDSHSTRRVFAAQLSSYLPAVLFLPAAPVAQKPPFVLPSFQGLLPRTTLAIVITLTAGMLGAVLTARYIVFDRNEATLTESPGNEPRASEVRTPATPSPPAIVLPTAAESAASRAHAAANVEPPPAGSVARTTERCACKRADSALWQTALPRLSLLILSKTPRTVDQHQELEVNIAAVNNGDKELRELAMMVQFYERDPPPSSKRYPGGNRAIYFEGPLGPGQAIKWMVQARGREFEVESPIQGDIGPGGDGAAPTNMLADLLNANHRPVRLHGAMMLAFLGDPRAREAVLKLKEALREDETPYLDRLLVAVNDIKACNLTVSGAGATRKVEACVYNSSSEPKEDLGLRIRVLDAKVDPANPVGAPPNVLSEQTWSVPGRLEAGMGVRSTTTLELPNESRSATVFEVLADRIDLLR